MKPNVLDDAEWHRLKRELWASVGSSSELQEHSFMQFLEDVGFESTLHSGEGVTAVAKKHGVSEPIAETIFAAIESRAKQLSARSLLLGPFVILGCVAFFLAGPSRFEWAHSWWSLTFLAIGALTGAIHFFRGASGLRFRLRR